MADEGKGHEDEQFAIGVRVTHAQLREITRRAGLGPLDAHARSEYLLGCGLGEPHDQLLERVHQIALEDRAQLAAETKADRAQGEAERAERKAA